MIVIHECNPKYLQLLILCWINDVIFFKKMLSDGHWEQQMAMN
jgi:hypothetical protein